MLSLLMTITYRPCHGIVSDQCYHMPTTVTTVSVPTRRRRVRTWRSVDRQLLRNAIRASPVGQQQRSLSDDIDVAFAVFDTARRDIADRLAPEHEVHSRGRQV